MTAPIAPLIVGGQGTFHDPEFHTEFPDRELSLEYMMEVAVVAHRFKYTHIVPSGSFTQAGMPDRSEAASFKPVWDAFAINLEGREVVIDEVALDSSENVICGLMALRVHENTSHRNPRKIGRIGFFSQWHFKKRRMTELANQLGIDKSFYFHGHAHAEKAAAGDLAKAGEQNQLDRMMATHDFLLVGADWERKRRNRYKRARKPNGAEGEDFQTVYNNRFAISGHDLKAVFSEVFEALHAFKQTTIQELVDAAESEQQDAQTVLNTVRTKKANQLLEALRDQVIDGNITIN